MRVLLVPTRVFLSSRRPPEGVVTKLAPSRHVPGCQGVFLTTSLKKFTPVEILPRASTTSTEANKASRAEREGGGSRASSTPSSSDSSATESAATANHDTKQAVPAPPYVCNLALAPRRTISLRRFLALRHSFSQDTFLNVATPGGWYLLAPSGAVPLPDPDGLARWQGLHHHRYAPSSSSSSSVASTTSAQSAAQSKEACRIEMRRRAYESLAKADSDELSEEELVSLGKAIVEEEAALAALDAAEVTGAAEQGTDGQEEEDDDDDDGGTAGEGATVNNDDDEADETIRAAAGDAATTSVDKESTRLPRPRRSPSPPLIPEAHLFHLNDAVYWPLPPTENVADPRYWSDHRLRMKLYQDTDAIRAEDHAQFLSEALEGRLRTPPREASEEDKTAFQQSMTATPTQRASAPEESPQTASTDMTQQQLYALSEALYRTATQKANAEVHVEDATGLVTLVPLMDLEEGTELLLHYGREWWLQRLLSVVLLAVPDAQMPQIRWIEGVCSGGGGEDALHDDSELDVTEPFPQLILARRELRHRPRRRHVRKARTTENTPQTEDGQDDTEDISSDSKLSAEKDEASTTAREGKRVLFNVATRSRATDAQTLAFAVRRSCLDRDFYSALLFWSGARRRRTTGEVVLPAQAAVFSLDRPDEEVPISALRHALMRSLEAEKLADDTDVEDVLQQVASSHDDEENEETTEETFSV